MVSLLDHEPENVIGPVAELLLEDSSDHVHSTCLDLLERLGAVVSLKEVRTDGWFVQLGDQIANFQNVCEVMGPRFLAYSIILGIQIRSLVADPRFPANTTIEFTLGDEQIQMLTLSEYRMRVVQAILQDQRVEFTPRLPLVVEDASAFIGGRMLLLSPLFDISLDQLVLASLDPLHPRAIVGYISSEGFTYVDLRDFTDLIRGRVRRDLAGTAEEPFQLDLFAVERAREAADQGNTEGVIAALESWPGLLNILQRTPVARQLKPEQLDLIGEGIALLGEAFLEQGREPWTEELFRLGLQFVRESRIAGRLFKDLGLLLLNTNRHGEAIGVLRRAQVLSDDKEVVLPALGRAFLGREQLVAAAAVFEKAAAQGIHVEDELAEVREKFKRAGLVWNFS
jgi:hypothetical protein